MTADWAFGPVCGTDFWRTIVISPEVLIFLFFMLTDPKTIPAGRDGADRLRHGGRDRKHAAHRAADDRVRGQGRLAGEPRRHVCHPTGLRSLPARSPLGGRPARPIPRPAHGLRRSWRDGRALGGSTGRWRALVVVLGAGIVLAGSARPRHRRARAASSTLTPPPRVDPTSLPTVAIDPAVTSWNAERVGRRRRTWRSRWRRTWRSRTWRRCAATRAS